MSSDVISVNWISLIVSHGIQAHVPETIRILRACGIKIWMLTGDKLATAVQIAYSCSLIGKKVDKGLQINFEFEF